MAAERRNRWNGTRSLAASSYLVGLLGGLGLLTAYAIFLSLANAAAVLVIVVAAMFLAVGLNPLVLWLGRLGIRRGAAVAIIAVAGLLLVCGAIWAVVPTLITQISQFATHLPGYVTELNRSRTVRTLDEKYAILEKLQSALTPANFTSVLGGVFGGVGAVFGTVFGALTTAVLTIYFLAALDRVKRIGYRLLPVERRAGAEALGEKIFVRVGWYVLGSLAIALVAGLASGIFMLVVGIPFPFALALVVALLDLVPMIGATLGAVVVTLVGFAVSIPVGIATLAFFIVYQQVENWLIAPRVMSRAVRISNLSAVVAALIGGSLLGAIGALIAIPLWAAIELILREVIIPRQDEREAAP